MAGVIRGAVLNVPTCSWGSPPQFASGMWAPGDVERSINARELLAIENALRWFAPLLAGSSAAVFADKSTAVSYRQNQGGTRSTFLNSIAQRILRWVEDLSVVISPQVIMGKHNVLADALSRPIQVLGSEWTLKQEVFRDLCRRSSGICAGGGRCHSDCLQRLKITVVPYIFLLTTITMLWGRMRFFETGMGGRRMLFLPGLSFRRV